MKLINLLHDLDVPMYSFVMDSLSVSKLAQADLNLLPVFQALEDEKSVTRAAVVLGLTQPAVSHALRRLRDMFDDSLFVKTSKGIVPTPRAQELSPIIQNILELSRDVVLNKNTFSPEKLDRQFNIWATDMLQSTLLPQLLNKISDKAPNVRISFQAGPLVLPQKELEEGAIDLLIAGFTKKVPDGFYQQRLYQSYFMCACRAKHPRLGKKTKLSLDDYCHEKHLLIAPGGGLRGTIDDHLAKLKRKRNVAAGISGFSTAGWVLNETDYLLTAPSVLLKQFKHVFDIKLFDSPVKMSPFYMSQLWHERNHRDPAHKWFREQIRELLQETSVSS